MLAALQRVFYNAEEGLGPDGEMVEGVSGSGDKGGVCGSGGQTNLNLGPPSWSGGTSPRRVSGASSVSGEKGIVFKTNKFEILIVSYTIMVLDILIDVFL